MAKKKKASSRLKVDEVIRKPETSVMWSTPGGPMAPRRRRMHGDCVHYEAETEENGYCHCFPPVPGKGYPEVLAAGKGCGCHKLNLEGLTG